ncbi:hypothetical protein [Jannaschia aquimarina]|uniref:hypothetical protein n=1 Tax=Jannaschia aquimarina TaxID=935700 RepID=UPI0005C653FB|nr:hypothetical protein [Jannaschia aquimarina]
MGATGLASVLLLPACAVELRVPDPASFDEVNACLAAQGLDPLDDDMRTPGLRNRQLTELNRCLDRRGVPTVFDLRRRGGEA